MVPTFKKSSVYLGRLNLHTNSATLSYFFFFFFVINTNWEAERGKNGEKRKRLLRETATCAHLEDNDSS